MRLHSSALRCTGVCSGVPEVWRAPSCAGAGPSSTEHSVGKQSWGIKKLLTVNQPSECDPVLRVEKPEALCPERLLSWK